jgi:xanthine dehydrogenase YagS FAD-binding subunit
VPAEEFFIGPAIDITRMTVMHPGDLLTSIRIPATWAGAKFYFEKVRDRQVWDFPLVNVASALKMSGGNIQTGAIVVNAWPRTRCGCTRRSAVAARRRTKRRDDGGRLAIRATSRWRTTATRSLDA